MFIVGEKPKSIDAEAYRSLRTNIMYSAYDFKMQTILVTSTEPGEGKSTVAGNLAVAFAQEGKRVLLIDCDLRKSSIHKKMMLSNNAGLTEVILGFKKVEECIQRTKEKIDVITAGKVPPNPSELLGSNKMKIFLTKLKEVYDYIIIDSPPVLAVTDATVLSTIVDGVVVVVRSQKVKRAQVVKAVGELKRIKANILGCVINDVKIGKSKYYYYGEDEDQNKRRK